MEVNIPPNTDLNNCKKHEMVFVKRIKSNGQPLINKQCLTCGEHDAKAYKQGCVFDFESLPDFNSEKKDQHDLQKAQFLQSIYFDNRKKEKEQWLENVYKPYLASEKWKDKRAKVLKRDNYLCQACLVNAANEVHHLSYKHIFNEPCFELTSVCSDCHNLITKLDNE
jgi:hypothetical protein